MDYMMLEPRTNECRGFVSDTEVMRELGLTFGQFKMFVFRGSLYKNCILIEDESCGRFVKDDEIEYRLIAENEKSGNRWYCSNKLEIIKVTKTGKRRTLKPRKYGKQAVAVQVNGKNIYIYRVCFEKFVRELKHNERVFLDGEKDIKNLKVINCQTLAVERNRKKCKVGDKVYNSIKECAEHECYSYDSVKKMVEGAITNTLGVEYA